MPGVSAKFFVYFLNLPPQLTLPVAHLVIPTYSLIMLGLLSVGILLTVSGGQISVMVTDCLEGIISNVFCLVVAFALFSAVSYAQMSYAFTHAPLRGKSLLNPFDISKQQDFNGWYIIIGFAMGLYYYRGAAWNAAFTAAGKSAHESKMAGVIGVWRATCASAMGFLIGAGAITLLRHPDFAGKAALVQQHLQSLPTEQLQRQMRVPAALGLLLPSGARGALCAVLLFGTLASLGASLHGFGSTLIQDLVVPLRNRKMAPATHIAVLRYAMILIAVFSVFIGWLWRPPDYLNLALAVISMLYLGGVGAVVWGGLYWKRATTAGAWTAMIVGAVLSVCFWFLQTFWNCKAGFSLNQWVAQHWGAMPYAELTTLILGWLVIVIGSALIVLGLFLIMRGWRKGVVLPVWIGTVAAIAVLAGGVYRISHANLLCADTLTVMQYLQLTDHWQRFPLNGQILGFGSMVFAGASFVVVSLLTCREPFNLDRMLHRGPYAVNAVEQLVAPEPGQKRWQLSRLIGIDEFYTRGDKILHYFTFWYAGIWQNFQTLVIVIWNLCFWRWPDSWWWRWYSFWGIYYAFAAGIIATVWFTIGTSRDLLCLLRTLPTIQANDADDGMVRNHQNLGEVKPSSK